MYLQILGNIDAKRQNDNDAKLGDKSLQSQVRRMITAYNARMRKIIS